MGTESGWCCRVWVQRVDGDIVWVQRVDSDIVLAQSGEWVQRVDGAVECGYREWIVT